MPFPEEGPFYVSAVALRKATLHHRPGRAGLKKFSSGQIGLDET